MIYQLINTLKKNKFFNHFIISLTLLIILILVYTTFQIYSVSLDETKKSHQAKQLELGKSAASGISNYLSFLNEELHYLARNNFSHEYFEEFYHLKTNKEILLSLIKLDNAGNSIFNFGKQIPQKIQDSITFLIKEKKEFQMGESVYSDVFSLNNSNDSLFFVILIRSNNKDAFGETTYLGYLISFDWLIKNFIEPLKLTVNDFAWMLDNRGRLIYHPNHEEMLFRRVTEYDQTCGECHASFDKQEIMLTQKMGRGEYHIVGEPNKIMAYVPVELNGNYWILSISSYLPSVISTVKNNFVIFFALSGLAILLIVLMGLILFSINLKRIKAEESEKFMEQSRSFQEKINHAAKLASIGELVDNVAHEINTPTGIISAETDTLFLKNCNPKNCCEELDIIKAQTRRIRDYTRSLLNYSKRMPFLPEINDIKELIDECLFLISPRIRAHQIIIKKYFEEDIPKFRFDRGRIEQVIINLLNNAIDAVTLNKEIIIALSWKIESKNGNSSNVELAITDYGMGIGKENINKIFDPFFSTKSADEGTGLGLSISNAIIKRHNGTLEVSSKVNSGSTFVIKLPINNNFDL